MMIRGCNIEHWPTLVQDHPLVDMIGTINLIRNPQGIVMLKFEPELLRTGPRFSSKFSTFVELDLKFSSGFSRIKEVRTNSFS